MTISPKPFENTKIPVCHGLNDYSSFIEQYPDFFFCPYVADKDDVGWAKSTSRIYMNQVLPKFLYVPVNIRKGDEGGLRDFFEYVQPSASVAAVNITQPHKSSQIIKDIFLAEGSIDTLIRDHEKKLRPFDLNSAAFVGWYESIGNSFSAKQVVIIGAGGVGAPIARRIAQLSPYKLVLVDKEDKSSLAAELDGVYVPAVSRAPWEDINTILINAAGKEGGEDSGLRLALEQKGRSGNVFIDIRPHLSIDEVDYATEHGWEAYTGHGMNARNDYELLKGITEYLGTELPEFKTFEGLVAQAS